MNFLYAQSQGQATGSIVGSLLPFILMFAIIYFLIIRPQRKKQKNHQKMLSEIKIGDEIITNGGIKGKVANLKQDNAIIILKIADNVKIEVLRSAVATKIVNKQAQVIEKKK